MAFLSLPFALPSARVHPTVRGAGRQAKLLVTLCHSWPK